MTLMHFRSFSRKRNINTLVTVTVTVLFPVLQFGIGLSPAIIRFGSASFGVQVGCGFVMKMKRIVETFQRERTDRLDAKSNKVRRVTVRKVAVLPGCSLPVASHCTRHLHTTYHSTCCMSRTTSSTCEVSYRSTRTGRWYHRICLVSIDILQYFTRN